MWIAAIVVIVLLFWLMHWSPMTLQTSASGRSYWVKKGPGQKAVADRLDVLSRRLTKLLDEADDAFPDDVRIANVRARWDGKLSEVESPGDIAYSMNKNSISVCIRTKKGLEDLNTSMYVLLHEIAHVATDTYGHPPIFWRNFKWLLEVAERLGYYEYQDFDATKVSFCGHTLGNSVISCVKRKTCKSSLK